MENNNKENMCSCHSCGEQKNSCSGCGGGCGSCCGRGRHSLVRILVGVIILIATLFVGFRMGLFFGNVMDGSPRSSYFGFGGMMNDFYKKGSLENCAFWQDAQLPEPTPQQ